MVFTSFFVARCHNIVNRSGALMRSIQFKLLLNWCLKFSSATPSPNMMQSCYGCGIEVSSSNHGCPVNRQLLLPGLSRLTHAGSPWERLAAEPRFEAEAGRKVGGGVGWGGVCSLRKRTLHCVITVHCEASRPVSDVMGSSCNVL